MFLDDILSRRTISLLAVNWKRGLYGSKVTVRLYLTLSLRYEVCSLKLAGHWEWVVKENGKEYCPA